MSSFRDWLARVLLHGESVQDTEPEFGEHERAEALVDLRVAFARHENGPSESSTSGTNRFPCRRTRSEPVTDGPAARLRRRAVEPLKARFVDRDEVIDLIALAVVAGEHLFLYGPPGTAKSLVVREFAGSVRCRYFEYLLTRFSEPTELFGPVDLARLREGVVATVTTGMLPAAEF